MPSSCWGKGCVSSAGKAAYNRLVPRWKKFIRFVAAASAWGYLGIAIALCIFLRVVGDRWWWGSVLLFGPRWVILLPLAVVLPLIIMRPRLIWVVLLSLLVVLGPLMGFCLPWGRIGSSGSARVTVLTCNIHSRSADAKAMALLIEKTNPDIVALQEWQPGLEQAMLKSGRWYVHGEGELLLASRYPIAKIQSISSRNWVGPGEAFVYELRPPGRTLRFINLHLASPHRQFETFIAVGPAAAPVIRNNIYTRGQQSQRVLQAASEAGEPLLIAGDFNMPTESVIFRRDWSSYSDAFCAGGVGWGYTYHSRRTPIRIDHVLSQGWKCRSAWTAPSVGSPHRPLVAVFE